MLSGTDEHRAFMRPKFPTAFELFYAVCEGTVDEVRERLASGDDPNAVSSLGTTPICHALRRLMPCPKHSCSSTPGLASTCGTTAVSTRFTGRRNRAPQTACLGCWTVVPTQMCRFGRQRNCSSTRSAGRHFTWRRAAGFWRPPICCWRAAAIPIAGLRMAERHCTSPPVSSGCTSALSVNCSMAARTRTSRQTKARRRCTIWLPDRGDIAKAPFGCSALAVRGSMHAMHRGDWLSNWFPKATLPQRPSVNYSPCDRKVDAACRGVGPLAGPRLARQVQQSVHL